MLVVIKRLRIWYWWTYTIKQNEFHVSLDVFSYPDQNQLIARREIAHMLDFGTSIWALPKSYVELF